MSHRHSIHVGHSTDKNMVIHVEKMRKVVVFHVKVFTDVSRMHHVKKNRGTIKPSKEHVNQLKIQMSRP